MGTTNGLRRLVPRGDTLPDDLWQRRHRFLVALLALHAVILPPIGIAAGFGVVHSIVEGGLVPATLAFAATSPLLTGRKLRSVIAATGLLTCSGLVVHLSGGYIEAHFHFFVIMVILSLYEDWLPFGLALAYVFFHHGVFGTISPESVYNHPDAIAHPWRWAGIHAAAISTAGLLSITSWRMNEEMRTTLRVREVELQRSNAELATANRELAKLDRLKTEFLAVAAHELRTPLTSVSGFTKTVLAQWDSLDDERRRTLLQIADEQGDHLTRLVGDLLDLSRLEAGELRAVPEEVELRALLDSTREPLLGGVEVRCATDLCAYADPRHVAQIVRNYVQNARKYGRDPIVIEARRTNGALEVAVSDAGDGVPAELVPYVFEKFRRDSSAPGAGAGLGLAIVRGLARANGGDAWYRPNGTRGSVFAVRLPAAP